MKPMKKLITASILGITVLSSSVMAMASENPWGAAAAAADTNLTLEDMLTYSLQDEYLAHAEYERIIETYGSVRPFSNIVEAETRHIRLLLPLFDTYGVTAPADEAAARIELPESLAASYTAGVEAEILNIDMYKDFLEEEIPDDVRAVFEKLLAGSEKHLAAFERAADREEGAGTPSSTVGSPRKQNQNKASGQTGLRSRHSGTGHQAHGSGLGRSGDQVSGKGPGKGTKTGPTGLRDGSCQ